MTGRRSLAVVALSLLICLGCRAQSLPAASADRPIGFGRATTGACNSAMCACPVTRLDDPPRPVPGSLRYCAEMGGRWTVFRARGTVQLERPLRVASDTTIDGAPLSSGQPPVTLSGSAAWLMLIDGSHNVIVRNLFFRLPVRGPNCANPQTPTDTKGCGLPLYIRGGARDVWIDHNDFDRCGEKCITVWNGRDRDAAGRALAPDLITISDNRLTNSYFGIAIGSGALLAPNELPQRMRITIYGNVFSNIFRRTPRAAANSEVHEFNNLIRHWGRPGAACSGTGYGFGASASGGAQIFLENNVFEPWPGAQSCKLAGETDEYDPVEGYHRGTGEIRGSGNLLLSGAQIEQTQAQQVFNPADGSRPDTYYPYQLRPVAGLAEQLEREAGVEGYPRAPLD